MSLELGSRVTLVPMNTDAIVVAVFEDAMGVQYRVRYWHNGEVKFEYAIPDELTRESKP